MAFSPEVLLIEPFYGGSHKQLMDVLASEIENVELVTMTAKKWHWRARTASLYLSQNIPKRDSYRVLFASSVLNLAELISLRPDLAKLKKVLYFHENQLVYPVRKHLDRDFQYGYNQVLSCLVADVIVFNSQFNRDSFLGNISTFMKLIPDYRPKDLRELIEPKCKVVYFPLKLPQKSPSHISKDQKLNQDGSLGEKKMKLDECSDENIVRTDIAADIVMKVVEKGGCEMETKDPDKQCSTHDEQGNSGKRCLHIIWPHRWEHDKAPDVFFNTLYKLLDDGLDLRVSVLGETYQEVPDVFAEAKERLSSHILHWGFVESKEQYYEVLRAADVVVSTTNHEFFGVAMLESVHLGCYPLCPNRLVYPEIFPKDCLYNTDQQLYKRLRNFCRHPESCRKLEGTILDVEKYSWDNLKSKFKEVLSWEL